MFDPSKMNFDSGGDQEPKVWRGIRGCRQGIGIVKDVVSTAAMVDRLAAEYEALRLLL